VVAGAALGGFAYYKFYLSNSSTDDSNPPDLNNSSLPHPTTIVPAGTQYTIDPGHHNDTPFTLSRAQFVTGSFGSSFNVSVYVMTPVQYQKLLGGANPATAGSQYQQGPTMAGSIFVSLPAGTYELVFYAPGPIPAMVNVGSPIQAM
jgi:hypothetical protein